MAPILELENIRKDLGGRCVVQNVSFGLEQGQIGCLLGPSGCGKTTLLRLVAGFERPDMGAIRLAGEVMAGPDAFVPPEARGVGMVFQDYALFPHLSVQDNVAFGLAATLGSAKRAGEMLELVGLSDSGGKYPHELSGGQQQRVALARALAPRPRILLLDEPLSNLDVALRERLSKELGEILRHEGITALMVTHNLHEAFAMADVAGVLTGGTMQQWAPPYELYHRPANPTVAAAMGEGVFLTGELKDDRVECGLGNIGPVEALAGLGGDQQVWLLVRPEDVIQGEAGAVKARVQERTFRGANLLYTLRLQTGEDVLALLPSHAWFEVGENIDIALDMSHVVVFAENTTMAPQLYSQQA